MKVFFSNYTLHIINIKKVAQLADYGLVIDCHHGHPRQLKTNALWLNPSAEDLEWLLAKMRHAGHSSAISVTCATQDPSSLRAVLRRQFNTIRAAGGVVSNPAGELLLIYRLGRWEFPKGKRKKHETLSETALREVEEECGVRVLCEKKLTTTYHAIPLANKRLCAEANGVV